MCRQPARLRHLRGMSDQQSECSSCSCPSFSSAARASRPELRLVHKSRLFQLGVCRFCFTRQSGSIPLRRFLIVEPLRFQSGGDGRRLEALEDPSQPERRSVRGTDQVEAVLRILPLCDDLFLIAVAVRRNLDRSRGLGKPRDRRNVVRKGRAHTFRKPAASARRDPDRARQGQDRRH